MVGRIMRRGLGEIAAHLQMGDVTTLADSWIARATQVKAQSSEAEQLV